MLRLDRTCVILLYALLLIPFVLVSKFLNFICDALTGNFDRIYAGKVLTVRTGIEIQIPSGDSVCILRGYHSSQGGLHYIRKVYALELGIVPENLVCGIQFGMVI